MDHMCFDISIPLVSNITLIVTKTNSLSTALYLLNEEIEDEIPHKANNLVQFSGKKLLILIQVSRSSITEI